MENRHSRERRIIKGFFALVLLGFACVVLGVSRLERSFHRSLTNPTKDERHQQVIMLNCISDILCFHEYWLKHHTTTNGGRLPSKGEATELLRLTFEGDLIERATRCLGSNGHFIWHPRLSELNTNLDGTIPLVWCPPGNHGRWVGAVVLENHRIQALKVLETNELVRLLEESRGRPSSSPISK